MSRYRRGDVLVLCVGITLVGSYLFWSVLGRGWLVYVAPIVGSAVAGVLADGWYEGAGLGGYSTGFGGFLFVTGNFWHLGASAAVSRGLFSFVLFAVVGVIGGGVSGFVTERIHGRVAEGGDGTGSAEDSPEHERGS